MSFIDAFSTLELKKLVRRFEPGDYLFQQGQMGQTMFIVLEGKISILAERQGVEHAILIFGPGDFLGEKALTKGSPYQRSYGARAQISSTVFEIGLKDIEVIRKTNPVGMVDILTRVFQQAITRLDKMNSLCRVLRDSDNHQRLRDLILFFARTNSKLLPNGQREFFVSEDMIAYHIDMVPQDINSAVDELISEGAIQRTETDTFVLLDESKLLGTAKAA